LTDMKELTQAATLTPASKLGDSGKDELQVYCLEVSGVASRRKECHFDRHEGTYPGGHTDSCL